MPIAPLHFSNNDDVCAFLEAIGLRRFVLLGKKNTLIARFTDSDLSLATAQYGAFIDDTPETFELIKDYFIPKAHANTN